MKARAGKKLEEETGKALKEAKAFFHNSNSWIPVCDKWGAFCGLSLVVECKELTDANRLPLVRFSQNERKNLDGHTRAGGLSLILIRHYVTPSNQLVLYACTWADIQWWELQEQLLRPTRPMKSLPVVGPDRPQFLIPVPKVTRDNSLGRCWDLLPLLQSALWCHLEQVLPLTLDRAVSLKGENPCKLSSSDSNSSSCASKRPTSRPRSRLPLRNY